MSSATDPSKELRLMLAFFGESELPKARIIAGEEVPEPYRSLLVHQGHMTVSLEDYHGSAVRVHPYVIHRHGDMYGRRLDLTAVSSGLVVMTGIMIINLSFVAEDVRQEILDQQIPLGRILISHGVLREVTTGAFLEIAADDPLVQRFNLSEPKPAYGRFATIYCDGKPAIDLLEVVRP